MTTTGEEHGEVARFYTRSRRFPKVIGRLHDGTRIPGGPYTVTQAVVGGLVIMISLMTRSQWGTGTILIDIPICLGVSWAAAWGAGRIPSTRRNLASLVIGGASAALRPFEGRYKEQTLRLKAPYQAGGTTAIANGIRVTRSTPRQMPLEVPVSPAVPPIVAKKSTISGVERLLQQARTK